ncbi:hypothetical protein HA051_16600 [Chromobacterium vaccinii]|nr:hypothetical protein [Chromobacterium vaccinii]
MILPFEERAARVAEVVESGQAQRDAQYVLVLPDKPARYRELDRLKMIYGPDYAHQVREEVFRIWEEAQESR